MAPRLPSTARHRRSVAEEQWPQRQHRRVLVPVPAVQRALEYTRARGCLDPLRPRHAWPRIAGRLADHVLHVAENFPCASCDPAKRRLDWIDRNDLVGLLSGPRVAVKSAANADGDAVAIGTGEESLRQHLVQANRQLMPPCPARPLLRAACGEDTAHRNMAPAAVEGPWYLLTAKSYVCELWRSSVVSGASPLRGPWLPTRPRPRTARPSPPGTARTHPPKVPLDPNHLAARRAVESRARDASR